MRNLFKIGLVSLALLAGASAVQAEDQTTFNPDEFWTEQEKLGV